MNPPTTTTLDTQALQRLRELDPSGRSRLLDRVLSAFESSAARLSGQLGEARRKGDAPGIRFVAHTLKSSSASIGALELSRLCAEIEAQLKSGAVDRLPERLDAMDHELGLVLQAVRTLPRGTPSS